MGVDRASIACVTDVACVADSSSRARQVRRRQWRIRAYYINDNSRLKDVTIGHSAHSLCLLLNQGGNKPNMSDFLQYRDAVFVVILKIAGRPLKSSW